jgi:hypothetical protein
MWKQRKCGKSELLNFNRAVCFLLLSPETLLLQHLTQKDIEVLFYFITFPIKQVLYYTLMYCQLRVVALLYAALDVSCNKAQGSPSLVSLGAKPNDSATALTNSRDTFSGIDELVLSSTRNLVGIESDNSPDCRLKWEALSWTDQGNHTGLDPKATVNLNFTLSSFDGSVEVVQRCKDTVGKLLSSKIAVRYQPGSLHADLLLFQQSVQKPFKQKVESIEGQSRRRNPIPFYDGTVYDYNGSLERKTRGLLGYLSALIYRYQPRGLIRYVKNRKLRSWDESVLFSLDYDSTDSQKTSRRMSSKPVPYNGQFRHERTLNEINDTQHVHNESADNKNNANNFHIEQRTQRTKIAIAVCAVSAVGTGVLYMMRYIPNLCA